LSKCRLWVVCKGAMQAKRAVWRAIPAIAAQQRALQAANNRHFDNFVLPRYAANKIKMLNFRLLQVSATTGNAGFSLIEVLVSILVLSFGIFGAMKMQLHSIQTSQQSNFYSTAMELASDIAEKMRSNQINSSPYLYVRFQSGKNHSEFSNNCHAADCSSDQLANTDISEWLEQIDSALPNASAVICRDSSPWNSDTNSLTWDCASADDNASVVIKLGWAEQSDAEENAKENPPPRFAVAVTPYF